MSARVTATDVQRIVDSSSKISMVPFIAAATALTDVVSSNDSDSLLNDALLKEIERYLAAHFYSLRDPIYTEKKTGDANGKFVERSYYEEAATLDITGYLNNLKKENRPKASFTWVGLPPSEQTDYVDRD